LDNQLALPQGLVGLALALGRLPGEAALALLVALLLEVFHPFEGDRASAGQGQVTAALQSGRLVELVTAAEQGDIVASADLATDMSDLGGLVALEALAPEAALALLLVQRVVVVL